MFLRISNYRTEYVSKIVWNVHFTYYIVQYILRVFWSNKLSEISLVSLIDVLTLLQFVSMSAKCTTEESSSTSLKWLSNSIRCSSTTNNNSIYREGRGNAHLTGNYKRIGDVILHNFDSVTTEYVRYICFFLKETILLVYFFVVFKICWYTWTHLGKVRTRVIWSQYLTWKLPIWSSISWFWIAKSLLLAIDNTDFETITPDPTLRITIRT